jgi:hypothetical protein
MGSDEKKLETVNSRGPLMTINAKVKNTGELFEANSEERSSGEVHALEEGKSYSGHLYTGHFDPAKTTDGLAVFRCTAERTPAIFRTDALEHIPLPIEIEFVYLKKRNKADWRRAPDH